MKIDNGLTRERQGDHSRSYDSYQKTIDGDFDLNVSHGGLRNGQILDIPYLIEFKMPVGGIHY